MTMIGVFVDVGVGMWKAKTFVRLVACPHVGDTIEVQGISITCERVHITETAVYVSQTMRFASEEDAKAYFK